jgi:transposase
MLYWESMKKRKSKISKKKQIKMIEYFVAGATARTAAILTEVNRKTAQKFFCTLRTLIVEKQDEAINFTGEVEVDESYFGGKRKGKRGRGAAGKIPVFGLLKRRGKVFAAVIPNVKTETLMPIINEKIVPDSIVYTDTLPSYNALDVSDLKHRRINHSKLFAHEKNHINGIENFWNQAKRNMRKFNGVPKNNFNLFLKECEWRFNFPSPKKQLKMLIQWMNLDV